MKLKCIALAAAFSLVGGVAAAATLVIDNQTDDFVSVTVDGDFGCNTIAHGTCTVPVSQGTHHVVATSAGGQRRMSVIDIGPNGAAWTIADDKPLGTF